MEALRKANAGTMQIEKFRDSALQIMVRVFFLALMLWATTSWYAARVLL